MSFSVKIKRITASMVAMGLAIALSAAGAAAQVTTLTGWVSGATNAKVSGSNRLMVVMAMGESTVDFSATGATYGGQTMTKQAEKMWTNGGRTYASIFTLNEAGVNAASSGTIAVTWSSNPSNGNNIYSVLLGNVDQAAPIGATATNAVDGLTVTTSALTPASGDMIIFDGGTGSNTTITFNNGFTMGFESNGGWGDGVGAYKMGTGASETPQFSQSASGRMVICAMVVKKSSGTTTYQLTTAAGTGGTLDAPKTNPTTVSAGVATTITASANTGYNFVNWTVTSGTATIANSTAASTTVTLSSGNATVQANFALKTYQLTVNAGTGGTRTVPSTSPVTVNHGVATTITALANTGYNFVNWTVTSGTATIANSTAASTTVTLSSGNATVQANFSAATTTYQLTTAAGTGGTVPEPKTNPTTVNSGVATTITAAANTGYNFVNWTVTSGTATIANSSAASTTVTLSSGNATVQANFALKTYQLTVNAGTGGTRTAPSTSPITVTHGVATTITASANTGYSFVDWTVTAGTATIANPALASTSVTLTSGNATVLANFAVVSGPKYPAQVTGPGQDMLVDGDINCNGTFHGYNFRMEGDAKIGNAENGTYIAVDQSIGFKVEISAGSEMQINLNPSSAPGSIEMKCNSLIVRDAPIECSSVKIGAWTLKAPDYVFEKGYKLRDLSEVERHIEANKHLPEVPSAAEMEKGGVDLAQLNMTLLKKVEELTLYAIEQDKRIKELEKKVGGK